jgi:hypothetical protein
MLSSESPEALSMMILSAYFPPAAPARKHIFRIAVIPGKTVMRGAEISQNNPDRCPFVDGEHTTAADPAAHFCTQSSCRNPKARSQRELRFKQLSSFLI